MEIEELIQELQELKYKWWDGWCSIRNWSLMIDFDNWDVEWLCFKEQEF